MDAVVRTDRGHLASDAEDGDLGKEILVGEGRDCDAVTPPAWSASDTSKGRSERAHDPKKSGPGMPDKSGSDCGSWQEDEGDDDHLRL